MSDTTTAHGFLDDRRNQHEERLMAIIAASQAGRDAAKVQGVTPDIFTGPRWRAAQILFDVPCREGETPLEAMSSDTDEALAVIEAVDRNPDAPDTRASSKDIAAAIRAAREGIAATDKKRAELIAAREVNEAAQTIRARLWKIAVEPKLTPQERRRSVDTAVVMFFGSSGISV